MSYHVSRNGSTEGPFEADAVRKMIADGSLALTDHLWSEGWEGWRPVSTEFSSTAVRPSVVAPPPLPTSSQEAPKTPGAVFSMKGVNDFLNIFPDKVEITPRGILGTLNKGFKGTKTIPFHSITAVQFKQAGAVLSGYLQFTILGGVENRGGIFAATKDENTFMFAGTKANDEALKIKNYVEAEVAKLRSPKPAAVAPSSVADELVKLADLKAKGILSDEEFAAAKAKLIAG